MTSKSDSSRNWLDLGYELFSEEGHEGLQVERLARILGKNKSGFYHFFGDKEMFLQKLMELHLEKEEQLIAAFQKVKEFDVFFIVFVVENKQTVLFQTQLVKNREKKLFQDTFSKVNQSIELAVRPFWTSYLGVSEQIAEKYWGLIRDTFYARVTSKTFNQDWLSNFIVEAKTILVDAQNDESSQ